MWKVSLQKKYGVLYKFMCISDRVFTQHCAQGQPYFLNFQKRTRIIAYISTI